MLRLTGTVLLLGLSSCGPAPEGTAVELADFVAYQRDNVTTDVISPVDPRSTRFATHGWRVDNGRKAGSTALVMRRDRARVWFFSADGSTRGVELRGGLVERAGEPGRRLLYRLNGRSESVFTMLPGAGLYVLDFEPGTVRAGWNALELRMRRIPGHPDNPTVRLRGMRFLNGAERAGTRSRGRYIEVVEDDLRMPAGSALDATFEVQEGARFAGRLTAVARDVDGAPIEVTVYLDVGEGEQLLLTRTTIEPSRSGVIDVSLEPWHGCRVRLRTLITGSPTMTAVWSEARVTGEHRIEPFDRLIRPSSAPLHGRLGRPDVLIVLLDAARADAFSPWGGPYPTPATQALADEGTRFARALSPSSWTGQAVPSILTGFYPDTVGVRQWGDKLTTEIPTLAEIFSSEGYQTALWSQHPLYSRGPTLARGFQLQTYAGEDVSVLPDVATLFADGRPSFAFIHLLPPHTPYDPPAPFKGRRSSWYEGTIPGELGLLNKFPKHRDPATLGEDDLRYIRDRYQENVDFADHLVGRLIDELRRSGRYDDMLVAVVSDHGEAFLEHDRFLHSRRIYQEFVHVPFVIKWPASVKGFLPVVDSSVSLVDLAPTLVAGLGLDGADRGFQGIDLAPVVFDGAEPERALYAVTRGDGDPLRAPKRWVRYERDGWSLLWDQLEDRTELYRLTEDPVESHDLAGTHRGRAMELLQELRMQLYFNQTLLRLDPDDDAELDPELARELEALGYL